MKPSKLFGGSSTYVYDVFPNLMAKPVSAMAKERSVVSQRFNATLFAGICAQTPHKLGWMNKPETRSKRAICCHLAKIRNIADKLTKEQERKHAVFFFQRFTCAGMTSALVPEMLTPA